MPYKSLPLGAFWTIFGRNFPTGVLQLLYPYQPANPLVESIFKALKFLKFSNLLKTIQNQSILHFQVSPWTVFDEESDFEVKNNEIQRPARKN